MTRIGGGLVGRMDGWVILVNGWMGGRLNTLVDERMVDGCMVCGLMDEWID